MDHVDLVIAARLERERAQKAQFTAMILRELAAETRQRYRAHRRVRDQLREPGRVGDLAL